MLATDADCARAETGELRLVSAILERAILDARKGRPDAVRWLASDASGAGDGRWSFVDVCDVLAIEPAWARAQIARGGRPVQRTRTRLARLEAA